MEIKNIRSTIDHIISYDLTTLTQGKDYTLAVKTKAGIEEPFRGEILVSTNHHKKPEITFSIMGMVKKELRVAPQFLHFGIIDTTKEAIKSETLERTVRINKVSGSDLVIERMEADADWIRARTKTGERGALHTIHIRLDRDNLPKGPFKRKVTIHTKHGEKAEAVDVALEGTVL